MNKAKNTLIELMRQAESELPNDDSKTLFEAIAEKMLAKGVIVLPAKIGQTVYVPWRWGGQQAVAMVKVEEIKFYDSQMHYMFLIDMESDNECFNQSFGGWKTDRCIGKTVFLTREEAEKALEGGANEKK